jgi:hypothetical protein
MHRRCLASSKRTFITRRATLTERGGAPGSTSNRSLSSTSVRQSTMRMMPKCRALGRYMRFWAAQHVPSAGTMTMLRASESPTRRHHLRCAAFVIAPLLLFPIPAALHPATTLLTFISVWLDCRIDRCRLVRPCPRGGGQEGAASDSNSRAAEAGSSLTRSKRTGTLFRTPLSHFF